MIGDMRLIASEVLWQRTGNTSPLRIHGTNRVCLRNSQDTETIVRGGGAMLRIFLMILSSQHLCVHLSPAL